MNKVKVPGGFANETTDQFGRLKIAHNLFVGGEKFTFYINLGSRKENTHGAYYTIDVLKEDMTEKDFEIQAKRNKDFENFLNRKEQEKAAGPTRPAVQPAVAKPVARPPVTQPVEEDVLPLDDSIF